MQKINWLLAMGILFLISLNSRAAVPDQETLAKIQAMTKLEVERQLARAPVDSRGIISFEKRIESLEDRVKNTNQTITFYSNFEAKKYRNQMVSFQGEIMRVCCPLKPATILDQQPWLGARRGKPRPGMGAQGEGRGPKGRGRANGKIKPVKSF